MILRTMIMVLLAFAVLLTCTSLGYVIGGVTGSVVGVFVGAVICGFALGFSADYFL